MRSHCVVVLVSFGRLLQASRYSRTRGTLTLHFAIHWALILVHVGPFFPLWCDLAGIYFFFPLGRDIKRLWNWACLLSPSSAATRSYQGLGLLGI